MKMSKEQKAVVEALKDVPLGAFPSVICPMLDDWISANPELHKKRLKEQYGYEKIEITGKR